MSENESAEGRSADGTASQGDPRTDGAAHEAEIDATVEADGETGVTAEGASESDVEGEEGDADAELRERVADADPEDLAREIAALRERAEGAEAQVEELESKLVRKQADFQNFKKRMERKSERERERATEDLVERLFDVRDNLVRALDQDEDVDIRPGVEKTLEQFDRVLDSEDVRAIEPDPGEAVDPERHEVLLRVASEHPEGTVDDVHRPGYEMADRVLRPAQVTVADENGE